jgi:seryl-tRNA(Sec) selenium transferase
MTPGLRRLYVPRPVTVAANSAGKPVTVDDAAVEAVREEWVVEDRWWTPNPLGRHYFELVLADGRDLVIFRSIVSKRWYRQRG